MRAQPTRTTQGHLPPAHQHNNNVARPGSRRSESNPPGAEMHASRIDRRLVDACMHWPPSTLIYSSTACNENAGGQSGRQLAHDLARPCWSLVARSSRCHNEKESLSRAARPAHAVRPTSVWIGVRGGRKKATEPDCRGVARATTEKEKDGGGGARVWTPYHIRRDRPPP
jgi:hypothetical protein